MPKNNKNTKEVKKSNKKTKQNKKTKNSTKPKIQRKQITIELVPSDLIEGTACETQDFYSIGGLV